MNKPLRKKHLPLVWRLSKNLHHLFCCLSASLSIIRLFGHYLTNVASLPNFLWSIQTRISLPSSNKSERARTTYLYYGHDASCRLFFSQSLLENVPFGKWKRVVQNTLDMRLRDDDGETHSGSPYCWLSRCLSETIIARVIPSYVS